MSGMLKWEGNALMLGATKMGEVRSRDLNSGSLWDYMLGPGDFYSKEYEREGDARQDCEAHVRRLLKKAGVGDA